MMKILVFVLAFIVLACGIIPCREIIFTAKTQDTVKNVVSAAHPAAGDEDECSPFCSCNCCCSITLLFTTYRISSPVETVIDKFVFQLVSKISDASLPVWQPPQLA